MAAKEILVKKYVVWLSDDEHEQLAALIRKGSSPRTEGADLVKGGRLGSRRVMERQPVIAASLRAARTS